MLCSGSVQIRNTFIFQGEDIEWPNAQELRVNTTYKTLLGDKTYQYEYIPTLVIKHMQLQEFFLENEAYMVINLKKKLHGLSQRANYTD
jgi:hypothetical protein